MCRQDWVLYYRKRLFFEGPLVLENVFRGIDGGYVSERMRGYYEKKGMILVI